MAKPTFFRVTYYDHEAKTMGFSEIITNDTEVMRRTKEMKKSGMSKFPRPIL